MVTQPPTPNSEEPFVTNAHVVNGCKSITAQQSEKTFDADIIAIDKTNDLAALRVKSSFKAVANFSDQQIELGEKVAAFGFPLYGALSSGGNFTIGYVSGLTGLGDDSRFLQISAPVQPGNSGGPLIDNKGRLVGVVTSKLNAVKVAKAIGDIPQNINFAIRAMALRYFLDANGIKANVAKNEKDKSDTELASLGKSISLIVKCSSK